jgi:2,3-bisphosphoglycerate-dependent phosphoglycerate mutase
MSSESTTNLIIVRHGQSLWNLENKFTGWANPPLTEKGELEAQNAGKSIASLNLTFDKAYTSYLKRSIHTLWAILKETDQEWLATEKNYRLNERHYGALTGLNKKETAVKYGDEQVFTWRRSFSTPPPQLELDDPRHPLHDIRYKGLIEPKDLPCGESLKECLERFMPLWTNSIAKDLTQGKNILIAAHGNSLRALMLKLEGISEENITKVEISTGVPIHYTLDQKSLKVLSKNLMD